MKESITEYDKLLEKNKNNIIDWYPFEENSTILQFILDEKIEELKINQNTKKVTKIEEITEQEKYDYIILIGNINKIENDFSKLVNLLNENGKILIITDNKLSVKSMCQQLNTEQLYTRKEIENLLEKEKLIYQKYYYVYPSYRTTNVIFTDKHLPDIDTISRNITFYPEDTVISTLENEKMKDILQQDENLFKICSNSFFIECSKKEFEDNKIEFVSYSNIRKEEFRIKTVIKGDKVYKTNANDKSKKHIEQIKKNIDILNKNDLNTIDSYNENTIISEYQRDCKTLDYIIVDKIKNGDRDEAINLIKNFYELLKEKLQQSDMNNENVFKKYNIEYENENISNLTFVKHGLWDLIFQNTFYKNKEYFFYDQEWYEENLPIEYIMYRTITYCKQLQDLMGIDKFYQIVGIKNENLEIFKELDDKLQLQTRSETSWKVHSTIKSIQELKNEIKKLEEEKKKISDDCFKLLNEKDARIKFLEENMESTCNILKQKEDLLIKMQNSASWKITKPLRILKGLKKGEKNEN